MTLWYSFFGRSKYSDPNERRSSSTTPIADDKYKYSVSRTFLKLGLIVAIPIILLHFYGQPALRIQYEWSGSRTHPIYHECDYLTLFDGWRDVRPRYGYCPIVTSFPFELHYLIGE